jgi:hypothetical protein
VWNVGTFLNSGITKMRRVFEGFEIARRKILSVEFAEYEQA